jgi:hypothetical protein
MQAACNTPAEKKMICPVIPPRPLHGQGGFFLFNSPAAMLLSYKLQTFCSIKKAALQKQRGVVIREDTAWQA